MFLKNYTILWILFFFFLTNAAAQWTQKGNSIVDFSSSNLYLGQSVSSNITGSTIAVGATNFGSITQKGFVLVYDWDGTNWIQKGQKIEGDSIGD